MDGHGLSQLLRFNWKPSLVRLGLAAQVSPGPCGLGAWSVRAGVPRNHLLAAVREGERLRLFDVGWPPEGLLLRVRPPEFWRERELVSSGEWALAWAPGASQQDRLALVTERADLVDGLWAAAQAAAREQHRIPVAAPDFGAPDSGSSSTRVCTRVKEEDLTRVPSTRVAPDSGEGAREDGQCDRAYLLAKLARMPRVEAEILRPQNGAQRRMGRLFWELERMDPQWLADRVGELPDRHEVPNKAAWLNRAMSERTKVLWGAQK